jgi:outer membrane receptor for ferrienterochelin and colicins
MTSVIRGAIACACMLASAASALAAQAGSITGHVTEKGTGAPIPNAQIDALGPSHATATSGSDGTYTISNLGAGTYTVTARRVGRAPGRSDNVTVRAGSSATVDFSLTTATELEQVVITASRQAEKVVDAPASVSVVSSDVVAARPALTPTDHIRTLPGIDVSSGGLLQANVVARGFNNIFSGTLQTLIDNRYASVPSLRVNVPYLIPTTNEDIERIEVVLGPGAALYGPNAANGVMNIITKSPFDSPGGSITVGGGLAASSGSSDVNVYRTGLRYAAVVNDKVAFKVSGDFTGGKDWRYVDPAEPSTVQRDFNLRKYSGEARLDVRPTPGTEWITSYGRVTAGSAIELTGTSGAAQVKDWTYQSLQTRVHSGRLFAQVFGNFSDAGDTKLLRTNTPIVDQSRLFSAQVQHGMTLGRVDAIYGLDYTKTDPRTGGTINGVNENDDQVTEFGGYLHTTTRITDQWQFLAAARLDNNNRVDGNVFSPRVALVYKPKEDQNFRITFNRAFTTPSNFTLFLDLPSGTIPLGPLGSYRVVALGVPKEGFQFRRDCNGGLCMRTPLAAIPGGAADPSQYLEADATLRWRSAIAIAAAQNPALAALAALPAPTKATVGTQLKIFDPTTLSFNPVNASDVRDIDGLKPSLVNALEGGYKGIIGGRMQVSVDVWHENRRNFVGPSLVETPNVFLDSATTARYLGAALPAPLAQAAAGGLAKIPLGTVSPDNRLTNTPGPDIIVTYRNYGKLDVTGADLASEILLDRGYSVAGNYSWVNKDLFSKTEIGGLSDVTLNAPANKAMVALRYNNNTPQPYGWELRGRYVAGFPVASGVYNGSVPTYTLLDANLALRVPTTKDVTLSISAQNLLDKKHQEFVGVPALGRFIMTQLRYSF